MQEQDPFESESTEPKPAPGGFVMQYFDTSKLPETHKRTGELYQKLANQIVEQFPEGTARTTLLERLLDIRDSVLKTIKRVQ